ncbi:PREDICTED: uncharacterized protein LOC104595782 [Nelumbo nucifera]|uniref:Uncharacterized protein LOC104595782 n=1 Tax=Nelumbo nucifera TaxID=4432 RepID=A0A1U7ZLR4_NELNU|nr:PREDICTED: uncharacterized protein LOC104595782 [Nelumbo nucifera]XP_019053242.1 PREDICTED: uncharacterized protein LOC104595782 [Nelumbo nucifera]
MSLLEVIKKAIVDSGTFMTQFKYPIILNADVILPNLKPESGGSNEIYPIKHMGGWRISDTDSDIIELGNHFVNKLKRKLKNPKSLNQGEFLEILNLFLEKNGEKVSLACHVDSSDSSYTCLMIEKLGFLISRDAIVLILEASLVLELWELLETIIVQGLVIHSSSSNLVQSLIEKNRSDLLCLCIMHISDLQLPDLLSILKYFLSLPKHAYNSVISVRKEWESQALLAIEKATGQNLSKKRSDLAKQASVLLMKAYDGFSTFELCLHYVFASPNLDELTLSSSVRRLNGSEMLSLIRYLGKWLRKYEKFPQSGPCPKAASKLGLKACQWVPSLETVVKSLGLVLDDYFSSLVLYSEFHEELKLIEDVVKSLASEARLCCSIENVLQNLIKDVGLCEGLFPRDDARVCV